MASSSSQTTILLFILIAFSSFKSSESEPCGIAVYWGQNSTEGTLRDACNTGLYKYINIAYLINVGSGQEPVLNLTGHCDPTSGTCRRLSKEIHFCQKLGIKVLLSLGPVGWNVSSVEDAKNVAYYLWTTFLAPDSDGPLGNARLDGIDIAIWGAPSRGLWDFLAVELAKYRSRKNIFLAVQPECIYPDVRLIRPWWLFNYIWVQFYNNPYCTANLIDLWNSWSGSPLFTNTQVFLGLPASPEAASSGYIPPDNLRTDILPLIRNSENYGGVMLWNRYYDRLSGYSSQIYYAVCDANLKLPSDGLDSNW